MGLVHAFEVWVPSCAVEEKSMDVAAVFGSFSDIVFGALFRNNVEVKGQGINWILILNKLMVTFLA